jgi:hypothetical protein
VKKPTIDSLLRDLAAVMDDDNAVVNALIRDTPADQLIKLLKPLLRQRVSIIRRNMTRQVERAVGRISSAKTLGPQDPDQLLARKELLRAGFFAGKGRWVSWAEATVQDHRDRIDFLKSYQVGISKTIKLHEESVRLIESRGVSCLGEIEDAA